MPVIVEDVFIGCIEHSQHIKDTLSHLGNQGLADFAWPQVKHFHASSGWSKQAISAIFATCPIPAIDAPDVLLLDNVNLIPLVYINQGYHWGLIWKGYYLENLLEAIIFYGNSVGVGAILGAININCGLDVIAVVAHQVHLIRGQDNVLEDGEGVGELPVNLTLREWSWNDKTFIVTPVTLPEN